MTVRLKIVLDTNVLLVSISKKSKYHWLYRSLIDQKFDLYLTSEILHEYEEVIAGRWEPEVAKVVLRTLTELRNVHKTSVYFKWNLMWNDPDDNKFVDCAFANNVHYVVSNDRHLEILKNVDFPQINVVNLQGFEPILREMTR